MYHTTTYIKDKLYLFGGESGGTDLIEYNDITKLDLGFNLLNLCNINLFIETMEWTLIETNNNKPCPRIQHSCVLLNDDKMIIFGGKYDYQIIDDLGISVFDSDNEQYLIVQSSDTPPNIQFSTLVNLSKNRYLIFDEDMNSRDFLYSFVIE